jgi:hypothetical protein
MEEKEDQYVDHRLFRATYAFVQLLVKSPSPPNTLKISFWQINFMEFTLAKLFVCIFYYGYFYIFC